MVCQRARRSLIPSDAVLANPRLLLTMPSGSASPQKRKPLDR